MVIRNWQIRMKRNGRGMTEWRVGMLEAEAVCKFALKMEQRTINILMLLSGLCRVNICCKGGLKKHHSSYSFFFFLQDISVRACNYSAWLHSYYYNTDMKRWRHVKDRIKGSAGLLSWSSWSSQSVLHISSWIILTLFSSTIIFSFMYLPLLLYTSFG